MTTTSYTSRPTLYLTASQEKVDPFHAFHLPPEVLVHFAILGLSTIGVELTEFRTLLYRRMNVPSIIINYTYLVKDSFLDLASTALSRHGLPLGRPDPVLHITQGGFMAKARIHRLTRSEKPGLARYLILLPASFASFVPCELERTTVFPPPSPFKTLPVCTVHIPRPSAVYACLLRLLSRYPKACTTRSQIISDLSELLMYDMYGMDGFEDEEDDEIELENDPLIQAALTRVRAWSKIGEWRPGEEWIGDALGAVIEGSGRTDYLPWAQ